MQHDKLALTIPWEMMDLGAQQQIIKVLHMPELVRLAVMPDVHMGYDLCIGGVALLRGAISPSFVGYDIGCGMCHVNTGQQAADLGLDKEKTRRKLFEELQEHIPAGVGKGHNASTNMEFHSACADKNLENKVNAQLPVQLGTLGSGNHFLEVGINSKNEIAVTIHSGSRRPGYDIASHYMKLRRVAELASDIGQAYLKDMEWAIAYALENRRRMLAEALQAIGLRPHEVQNLMNSPRFINETHNHAIVRTGQAGAESLVLHRKGATPADAGQLGIIPANQRDGVWVTVGLGNEEFLSSASHGAGRKSSRKEAAKGEVQKLEKAMKGIVCRTDKAMLDEAPWAYKDIDMVLKAQDGLLVNVIDHFTPLVVLKG